MRRFVPIIFASLFGGLIAIGVYKLLGFDKPAVTFTTSEARIPNKFTSGSGVSEAGVPADFTMAADKALPCVVHIKSKTVAKQQEPTQPKSNPQNPFHFFFGPDYEDFFNNPNGRMPQRPQASSGSGVVISADGYIVTNNHVVDGADEVEVSLYNQKSYIARVVGTDPSTDLALIQIKESNLPFLPFANSDDVRVGQWALAVGNPYNLESTVTAGIVSAKGRNINILRDNFAVESFIQTDAAVNPGNSGGALVDAYGNLIGINTAIASPTGSYSGYSFAVPSNIAKKITEDLLNFGTVQRGYLGIMIRTVDSELAKKYELTVSQGVYVDSLVDDGAAKASGIKSGDVITSIDGQEVKTSPELQEKVARKRPGDKVMVKLIRKGKEKTIEVLLKGRDGEVKVASLADKKPSKRLGLELEVAPKDELVKLNIDKGVKVKKIIDGKVKRETSMRTGFIITKVNFKAVSTPDEFEKAVDESKDDGVIVEGYYLDQPGKFHYGFGK